ncbi:MAG TPA: helix-turn-helix transcriptional regulator [Candidatus Limnocylindrales bacterium]|nr:helix-turn-helix transcriptional regulator [Candidatus Limnocylindrales bacterium]
MVAVSSADVRGMLRFLDTALPGPWSDPFPRPTLAALNALIPADLVEYFELRRSDRSVVACTTDRDLDALTWVDDVLAAYGHQNPIGLFKWTPSAGPLRLSTVMRPRELRRTEWFDAFLRPLHISDSLKVWLWSSAESAACVCLDRYEGLFSGRDQTVLAVLQSHLIALRDRGHADVQLPRAADARLTPREAEVVTWAARGKRNDEIARILVVSPSTVAKHLENVYLKLGATGRSDAVARLRTGLS